MSNPSRTNQPQSEAFLDGFTRAMLGTMFIFLLGIFASAKYMNHHKMEAAGTDDRVNTMAAAVSHGAHHPFIDLPGDSQLGAFSVAHFFAGIIVGYHWLRLFGKGREPR